MSSIKRGIFAVLTMMAGITIFIICGSPQSTYGVDSTVYLMILSIFIIIFGVGQFVQAWKQSKLEE